MERAQKNSSANGQEVLSTPELDKFIDELSTIAIQHKKAGNLGMAKHVLIQACQQVIKNRELLPAAEKNRREQQAKILLG